MRNLPHNGGDLASLRTLIVMQLCYILNKTLDQKKKNVLKEILLGRYMFYKINLK